MEESVIGVTTFGGGIAQPLLLKESDDVPLPLLPAANVGLSGAAKFTYSPSLFAGVV